MANKYCNLDGSKKIKDEYQKINIGFDKVEEDVNKINDDINALDERVDEIITTPVEDVSAEEIIDARGGRPVLGKRFEDIETDIEDLEQDLDSHKAEKKSQDVHGLGYGGVFVTLSANQSIPSDLNTVLVFDSVSRQSKYVFWDSNNPTRVTIPVGVNKVRLVAQVVWRHNDAGRREAAILKNGSPLNIPRAIDAKNAVSASMTISEMSTPLAIVVNEIDVSEGDFFELQVKQTSNTALPVMATGRATYLALEVIE